MFIVLNAKLPSVLPPCQSKSSPVLLCVNPISGWIASPLSPMGTCMYAAPPPLISLEVFILLIVLSFMSSETELPALSCIMPRTPAQTSAPAAAVVIESAASKVTIFLII